MGIYTKICTRSTFHQCSSVASPDSKVCFLQVHYVHYVGPLCCSIMLVAIRNSLLLVRPIDSHHSSFTLSPVLILVQNLMNFFWFGLVSNRSCKVVIRPVISSVISPASEWWSTAVKSKLKVENGHRAVGHPAWCSSDLVCSDSLSQTETLSARSPIVWTHDRWTARTAVTGGH